MQSQLLYYANDKNKSRKELLMEVAALRRHVLTLKKQNSPRSQAGKTTERSLLDAQNEVLESIATGMPLIDTLATLAQRIEEQLNDAFCSILLLDETGSQLYLGAAPSFPES